MPKHPILITAVLAAGAACQGKDDAGYWIDKLEDPERTREAVDNLRRIADPAAIEPLCKLYAKVPHDDVMRAIVSLKGAGGFAAKAVPTLIAALEFEEENYTSANRAAEVIGDLGAKEAIPALVQALDRPLSIRSRANLTKLTAIDALVKIGDAAAVEGLIRAMERPPEEQDFFVAKRAAEALGILGDARAARPLVRGLFYDSTRHKPMWLDARPALVRIGKPSVQPLIDAMQGTDEELNALARKLDFRSGILEYKTAYALGDLRDPAAIPALRALLAQPEKGEGSEQGQNHAGAIYALGMIGTDEVLPDLLRILKDPRANYKTRVNAAQALLLHGSPKALPDLLAVARTGFVTRDGEKYDDVRLSAAMSYARLAGADGHAALSAIADKAGPAGGRDPIWDDCLWRLEVARDCKDDAACYAKALLGEGTEPQALARQESAAFHFPNVPGAAGQLDALVKKVGTKSDIILLAVLYALDRAAPDGCKACVEALQARIDKDGRKTTFAEAAAEMRTTLGRLLD